MRLSHKVYRMSSIGIILAGFIVLMAGQAAATPALGVATDSGTYVYGGGNSYPDPENDAYIYYFADTFVQGNDAMEGFHFEGSGHNLTVFTKYNPASTQIYLLAETGGEAMPMSFGSLALTMDDEDSPFVGKCAGYDDNPYAYVALPQEIGAGAWTEAPDDFPNQGYYFYTAQFVHGEGWDYDYYLWAAAELNGTPGLQFTKGSNKDGFSPKTSSAHAPEPGTLFLLIMGLMGFVGVIGYRKYF